MFHNPILVTEIDILLLLAVACLAAIALKRIRFPFWGITAYATRTVTAQLQTLFQESGLGDTLLQPCITQYGHWHQTARQQLTQLSSETESLIVNTQTQVTEQVAQNSQSEVIKNMIAIGALNQTIGSSLLSSNDS